MFLGMISECEETPAVHANKDRERKKRCRERERGRRISCHFIEAILRFCNKGRILILDGISANHSDEYFHSLSHCDSPSGTDETYLCRVYSEGSVFIQCNYFLIHWSDKGTT